MSKWFVQFSKDEENQEFSGFGTMAQAKYDVFDTVRAKECIKQDRFYQTTREPL